MDKNFIRSIIFLIAGLVSIFFQKELNDFKNSMFKKLNMKNRIKDERKVYFYTGIFFIIISVILFLFAYLN